VALTAPWPGVDARLAVRFTDPQGTPREVLIADGEDGAAIVFERPANGHAAPGLVGSVAADEPSGTAEHLAELFALDAASRLIRCRALPGRDEPDSAAAHGALESDLIDARGQVHRLQRVSTGASLQELRWLRDGAGPVSVRDVVGALQTYAPVRAATEAALGVEGVSTATLRAELGRVLESPILLNRCLRERVGREVSGGAVSMGEIALRCGRTKRDSTGNRSGDTSWLARRIGLMPEGGSASPTPWVHTAVLALIARSGLCASPLEVETP